ncbi:hypothetical protein [Cytobacillus sp. FSL K6-0265]|uniref:hypothetical protein n=1 Tax=Cytobacillus sp. FSL K6-0265 TaxID=2921448 RepID=UPI0030F9D100
MTVINIYSLNKNHKEQMNLFYSKDDGYLDLEKIAENMGKFNSLILDNGVVDGEGFLKVKFTEYDGIKVLEAFATGQGSLGYYAQAYIDSDNESDYVNSRKQQQQFYSKAKIFILETYYVIVVFEDTTEEKIKGSIKNLIEKLGFEVSNFRLTDTLMRNIRNKYKWNEVRLEKVKNEQDSTTKVQYEKDVADSENDSLIDSLYKDQGKMVYISFELPAENIEGNVPNFISVKLYKNDHRIVINQKELPNNNELKKFIIYLSNKIIEIVGGE